MAHAEICLICGGKGKLPDDGKSTVVTEPICHGCSGLGWITVNDESAPITVWPDDGGTSTWSPSSNTNIPPTAT